MSWMILLYASLVAFVLGTLALAVVFPKRQLYFFFIVAACLSISVALIWTTKSSDVNTEDSSGDPDFSTHPHGAWCPEDRHYYNDDKTIYRESRRLNSTSPIRIAYLILVHSRDSVLASKELLKTIWRPDFYYLYMVDKNTPREAKRELLDFVLDGKYTQNHPSYHHIPRTKPPNLRLALARVNAGWGSLGLVQNELDGLQELLSMGRWDYAINLSGDTFPLVTQARLVDLLLYWNGKNFVHPVGLEPSPIENEQPHKRDRMKHVQLPTGLVKIYYGSQWFVLTRSFVKYSLFSPLARNLLVAFATAGAWIADENFFQTLVYASPFKDTIVKSPDEAPPGKPGGKFPPICRFEKWWDCRYKKPNFPREFPCFLGERDYDELTTSSCIFARKFEPGISERLYVSMQKFLHQMDRDGWDRSGLVQEEEGLDHRGIRRDQERITRSKELELPDVDTPPAALLGIEDQEG